MATVLYEYFHLTDVWFKTGIIPNINTRIEVDNAGYNTIGDGYYTELLGSHNTDWDNSAFVIKLDRNSTKWAVRVGNRDNLNCGQLTLGNRYSISLDKNYFTFNGTQYTMGSTSFNTSTCDIWIGTVNNGGSNFRNGDVFAGNIRIYQDNVLVGDFRPCIKDGEYCFYDNVTGTYHEKFGSGTVEAFNPLHIFSPSQSKLSFQSIQSSQNITITAETGWTATTNNNWITLPINTGVSGNTNITVTVADGSNDGSRVGKITFTDADNYTFDVDVYQLKLGMKVYVNKYKVGSTSINKQQRGDDNVNKMYMGNDLVYQKLSFAPTLSINVDSMEFKYSGDTAQTVTVNSNTDWTYSTDVNWLIFTKSGNTLSILPQNYTSEVENRTATVTITADNGDMQKTKTISVTQKKVMVWEAVDYVYTNETAFVNTNIYPTPNTKFRVKVKAIDTNVGSVVGYWTDTPTKSQNDNDDYRFFFNTVTDSSSQLFFDFNTQRINYIVSKPQDGLYDITCGNNYMYNNTTETIIGTRTTQTSIANTNVPIYICIYGAWEQINQVTIYDNDVVVFDGYAADVDGDYGIYNTVSETLLKPTNGATVYKGTW